jgi:hypothetical protein
VTWPLAFALTQLFELPVVLLGTPTWEDPLPRRLAVGFGASALTHPVLWFVLHPLLLGPLGYAGFFLLAESVVVLTEGAYFRAFGVPRPFLVSLAANAFSAGLGLLLGPWLTTA